MTLVPNPPPTSGVITSTATSGNPKMLATAARTPVDVCVEVRIRRRWSSGSQRAWRPGPAGGGAPGRGGDGGPRVTQLLGGHRGHVARDVGMDQVLGGARGLDADHGGQRLV